MAIKTFKEILDNKGYRIDSKDRAIFEQGNLQSFFGFGEQDAIEFIIYDTNDNQLPQKDGKKIRYIELSTENIKDYFMIAEGTIFAKYQLPSEYFIDVERLLREAGYNNGIFKTQITLLNKRVGNDGDMDKLWISEISPSRTEVRLFPIRNNDKVNTNLEQRYDLFIRNGEFRDDTINLAFNFIEKISPTTIDNFMKTKYTANWYDKMVAEFKVSDFKVYLTNVHKKFTEACMYEFSHRVSDINSTNYGKPLKTNTPLSLSKEQIKEICKRILVTCINYYLPKQDIVNEASSDLVTNASLDEVGIVLQRLETNTSIDTSSPVIKKQEIIKPIQTNVQLELEKQIKKQLEEDNIKTAVEKVIPAIITPVGEPDYIKPIEPSYSGGGGGGGGQFDTQSLYEYNGYNDRVFANRPDNMAQR